MYYKNTKGGQAVNKEKQLTIINTIANTVIFLCFIKILGVCGSLECDIIGMGQAVFESVLMIAVAGVGFLLKLILTFKLERN